MMELRVPETEIFGRLNAFRETLISSEIDIALVAQTSDLYYFTGTAQSAFLAVIPSNTDHLFARKYLPRVRSDSPIKSIQPIRRFRDALDAIARYSPRRIGIESDVLPVQLYQQIQSVCPDADIIDVSHFIRRIRSVKSSWEIDQISRAAEMLDKVFGMIPLWLKEDMQEIELAARIESFLRLNGHQGYLPMRVFNGVIHYGNVLFGPSGASRGSFDGPTNGDGLYPATPSGAGRNRLSPGQPVFVDLVAGYNGYLADATRVYSLGSLPEELVYAHDLCIEIQDTVKRLITQSTSAHLIYKTSLDRAASAGLDRCFMGIPGDQASFIAHGVGIEIDELPVVTARSEFHLASSSVLAIEPKFVFPEIGAVGIENTWVLTDSEPRRLTQFPDDLLMI